MRRRISPRDPATEAPGCPCGGPWRAGVVRWRGWGVCPSRLELVAHELHLFTKGVHEALKRGRLLTSMNRCPRLFRSSVHGRLWLFIRGYIGLNR